MFHFLTFMLIIYLRSNLLIRILSQHSFNLLYLHINGIITQLLNFLCFFCILFGCFFSYIKWNINILLFLLFLSLFRPLDDHFNIALWFTFLSLNCCLSNYFYLSFHRFLTLTRRIYRLIKLITRLIVYCIMTN